MLRLDVLDLLAGHAAALIALVGGLLAATAADRLGGKGEAPAIAAAVAVGWAVLAGRGALPHAFWVPRRGIEVLLLPALVSTGLALLLDRGVRRRRLVLAADAAFAGWWIARHAAAPADFWRVWILVSLSAALLGWLSKRRADRALASGLALWGGLLVTAGARVQAADAPEVFAAGALGAVLASRDAPSPPAALLAALLAVVDLSGGRSARIAITPADLACLAALAAPALVPILAARLGGGRDRLRSAAAPIGAALVLTGLVYAVRRATAI